jgi:hypothetical protein
MKNTLWAAMLWVLSAFGADVSGKWNGTFELEREGEKRSIGAQMDLTQDGDKLTGTVGPEAETPLPIKGGRIEGATVRFEVQTPNGETIAFDLIIEGDHLTGQAKSQHEGVERHARVEMKRMS